MFFVYLLLTASSMSEAQLKQPLVVATAHIHWDPEFSDVKLIQTMMLMWRLKHVIEENFCSSAPGSVDVNSVPLILCGDLNSLPESGRCLFTEIYMSLIFTAVEIRYYSLNIYVYR